MVLGDLGSVLGDPGRVLVNFWRIFGAPGGRKKKLHFREANRMKLSGTKYSLLKTKKPCLIHGSISEKLSLYQKFEHFFFEFFFSIFLAGQVPGGRHRAREAGPDREISKNTKKQFFFWPARAGPESGISVLRILLSPSKP